MAVQAVWEEAAAEVQTLAGRFFLGGRKGRRLMEFVGLVIKGDAM